MPYRTIDCVSKRVNREKEKTVSSIKPSERSIKGLTLKLRIKKQHLQKIASAYLMLLMVFQSVAGVFMWVPKGNEAKASSSVPDQTIFDDSFETGTGKWVINSENLAVSDTVAHTGSNSLAMNSAGDIYKKFRLTDINEDGSNDGTGLNSPNRDVSFYWYPQPTGRNLDFSVFSLEEGAWSATDKTIEMFWNNDHVYFNLYRYLDGARTSTTTSSNTAISSNAWHKIEIISNTTLTQIKIDDVPVQFSGSDSSSILTNVYNWIRFTNTAIEEIKEDDNERDSNTPYISGNTIKYKKELTLPYDPISIYSAKISLLLDKDNTLVGSLAIDINGQRALLLTDNEISPANSNPGTSWYSFSIDKSLLLQGVNSIVIYSENGTTNSVLLIDSDSTSNQKSARSVDGGSTWTTISGEYMMRFAIATAPDPYYVDDITVKKENIVNTSDLFGRTFDALSAISIPSGNDKIFAIYQYLLTRDDTYLSQAQTGADSIQSAYDSGNKNLPYVKEMAILSGIDSSRQTLLNNLADLEWTYKVNQTTYLPYYVINSDGSVSNYNAITADAPDALSVVNDFTFAYKTTSNSVYLDRAKTVLDAIYAYMRHPTYDTMITGVDARTGVMTYEASRGDDQITNFIETALFLYETCGEEKYLTEATYQADKWSSYSWDSVHKLYRYRPDSTSYEAYIPSFSLALLHLYEYTHNQTYLNNAEDNYMGYMTQLRRNGLVIHAFLFDGKYGHEYAYFQYSVPIIASLLYKYTENNIYLDISDEYTSILVDYYYTARMSSIASDSFTRPSDFSYSQAQKWATNLFYRFILPSSGVKISWAYGNDLHEKYRDLGTAPLDVSFARDAVHLYNVSGNGTIKFDPAIKKVYITSQPNSAIGVEMLNNLSITPASGAVNVETADSTINIDYQSSTFPNLTANNIDRPTTFHHNNTTSLTVSPSSGTINLTINTWNTTTDYYKKWTEDSNNHNITTNHTIGDLTPNASYILKVDGQEAGIYDSNNNGQITFTYQGGYSQHTFEIEQNPSTAFIPPIKPQTGNIAVSTDTTGSLSLNNLPTNITQIAISTNKDFTNVSWEDITKKEELLKQYSNQKEIYIKLRTDTGAVSDTITYTPQTSNTDTTNHDTTNTIQDGDIVKTPNNPDIYVIKIQNNKKYKRLILSPYVFNSYQHLKWENIKTISEEQLNQYQTSSLIQEATDTIIYALTSQGDQGQRKPFDITQTYDPDSIYTINKVDRDSYEWEE